MTLEPEEQALGIYAPRRARTPAEALRLAAQIAMDQSAMHFAKAVQLQAIAQRHLIEAAGMISGGMVQ